MSVSIAGITAAAAVVGAGTAVYSASKSADAQSSALDAQRGAAASQAQISQEQLDFNKQVYNDGKASRDFALKNAEDVSGAQLSGMQFATDQAKKDATYREGTFQPLEKGLVSDASTYDTPQRRADAAAAAEADVDQSYAATRAASERDLARSGIAPGSGKAMALQSDAAVAQAASRAGAGTLASRNIEQQGYARRTDAANLGRNLPSSQAAQQSIASNTGTASTNAGMAAVNAQSAGIPNVNAGYAGGIAANNSAGNLYGSAAGGYGGMNAAISSGLGSLGRAVGSGAFNGLGSTIGGWFGGSSTYGGNTNAGAQIQPGTDYNYGGVASGWADGGPVRAEPVVGTKGPVRNSGAGPMSTAALVKTLAKPPATSPAPDSMAALPANPLTNPKAVIEGRLKGYASGGPIGMPAGFGGNNGGVDESPAADSTSATPMQGPSGGGYGVDQFGPDFGAVPNAAAPVAPVFQPHNMTIQPVRGMGAVAASMAPAAPVATTMPTRVDGVPMGVGPAPAPALPPVQPPPTRVDGVPQGVLAAPAAGLPPPVNSNVMPMRPGMGMVTQPRMAIPRRPTPTLSFARGGAVPPPIIGQTAPPVVPSAAPNPRSMPRMGGAPSAPANRGSYQAVPLSKGKAFAKGGMVSATRNYAAGAAVRGPGGPTDDMIPAMLSDGEHVLKTKTVNAIGGGSNDRGQAKLIAATKAIDKRARRAA